MYSLKLVLMFSRLCYICFVRQLRSSRHAIDKTRCAPVTSVEVHTVRMREVLLRIRNTSYVYCVECGYKYKA